MGPVTDRPSKAGGDDATLDPELTDGAAGDGGAAPGEDLLPTRIAHYEVRRELGRGGKGAQLWTRMTRGLEELKGDFVAEGNLEMWTRRYAEAVEMSRLHEEGHRRRFCYAIRIR